MDTLPQNALDFLGFTSLPTGVTGQITKCTCGIEGIKAQPKKIRRWYHWFVPLMWKYYTAMDKDPYCDSFECPKCGRRWRTPKLKHCLL